MEFHSFYCQALEILGTVTKAGLTWSNKQVSGDGFLCVSCLLIGSFQKDLEDHYRVTFAALDHPELPVRVQAALALTEMVLVHEEGSLSISLLPWISFDVCSENGRRAASRKSHSGSAETF